MSTSRNDDSVRRAARSNSDEERTVDGVAQSDSALPTCSKMGDHDGTDVHVGSRRQEARAGQREVHDAVVQAEGGNAVEEQDRGVRNVLNRTDYAACDGARLGLIGHASYASRVTQDGGVVETSPDASFSLNEETQVNGLAVAEGEHRATLLRAYTDALIHAQTTHDAFDWIAAGSAFWRYARAATGTQAAVPPFNNPFGAEQPR